MKITYNKNPLYTTIELDDIEKKELWYKIKIEEMEEMEDKISSASVYDQENETFHDLNCARDELDLNNLNKRVDDLFEYCMSALVNYHVGDCTCQSCSCTKCWTENLLGLDTLEGLGKHSVYKINNAFGEKNEKNMQEALNYLKNYDPKTDWEGYEPHVSRWKIEADEAYKWLLAYANNHFNNEL